MPDTLAPPDYREPLYVRIKDAGGWLIAIVVSNVANLGHTWQSATPRERLRLAFSAAYIPLGVLLIWMLPAWLAWPLLALWIIEAFADLDDIALAIADRSKTTRLMQTTPTGAPRMAEIQCSKGVTHRFLYGPSGWEEAGPAVHAPADA